MDISPYTKYVRSMAEHGERRITEINWLFESVEKSLARAETNFIAEKKSRAYISLRHAKNLTGFLQKSDELNAALCDSRGNSHVEKTVAAELAHPNIQNLRSRSL